ncbi:MAG: acyl carrier protein, partial [Acidobacteriota bacterium]
MDTKSLEKKSVNEVDFAEASYDQQVLKSDDNKVEILGRLQELILEKVGVELTPEEPFETMALDSLRAVELETRISDEFDLDLAPSMLTPDSNLLRLAEHICACKADEPAPTKKPTQRTAEKVLSYRERLASHREQVAQMITNDVMCYGLAQDGMVSPVSIMLNNR